MDNRKTIELMVDLLVIVIPRIFLPYSIAVSVFYYYIILKMSIY